MVALEAAARLGMRVTGLALIGAAPEMPVNAALMTAARENLPQAAALIASAVTTPASAIAEPTERSIPPLMMIIVMPIAPIATMTVCTSTVRRFLGAR